MVQTRLDLDDQVATDDVAAAAKAVRRRTLAMLLERGQHRLLKPSEDKQLRQLLAEFGHDETPALARSTEELAAALGVVKRTVLRWLQDGAPRRDDGLYDVAAVAAWAEASGRQVGEPAAAEPAAAGGTDWARKLKAEQAKLQETKRRQLEGKLVPRRQVARLLAERVVVVKSGLLYAVPRLAEQLAGMTDRQEVAALLNTEFRALVVELAAALPPSLDQATPCPHCGEGLNLAALAEGGDDG